MTELFINFNEELQPDKEQEIIYLHVSLNLTSSSDDKLDCWWDPLWDPASTSACSKSWVVMYCWNLASSSDDNVMFLCKIISSCNYKSS